MNRSFAGVHCPSTARAMEAGAMATGEEDMGLCLDSKFLSLNFIIHLSYQIFYLIYGALNIDK